MMDTGSCSEPCTDYLIPIWWLYAARDFCGQAISGWLPLIMDCKTRKVLAFARHAAGKRALVCLTVHG